MSGRVGPLQDFTSLLPLYFSFNAAKTFKTYEQSFHCTLNALVTHVTDDAYIYIYASVVTDEIQNNHFSCPSHQNISAYLFYLLYILFIIIINKVYYVLIIIITYIMYYFV